MNHLEKQLALERYQKLVLATLDYMLENFTGDIVFDDWDPARDFYEQQKTQTGKYFKQRRLDKLQQRLYTLTNQLCRRVDLKFAGYIKEKIGEEIDIFAELRNRVDNILERKQIYSDEEIHDITLLLRVYQQTETDPTKEVILKSLVAGFVERQRTIAPSSIGNKADRSDIIKREEKDGKEIVTVQISSGPKPSHHHEEEAVSPDGKRKLLVIRWASAKSASTYVEIRFKKGSGSIYGVSGLYPDLKASWKDNNTIVVETSKEYLTNSCYKKIRSHDDEISVEYIFHDKK